MKLRLPVILILFFVLVLHTFADFQNENYATALQEMKLLAEQGNALAQYYLGGIYVSGNDVPEDYEEAIKWYTLAAKQGDVRAQFYLGRTYADLGDLVPGYMWYSIASLQEHEVALWAKQFIVKDEHGGGLPWKMTSTEIETAKELSKQCLNSAYKNCDY